MDPSISLNDIYKRLFVVVSDDAAETPGRCIRAKNLAPCSTNADCTDADETCSPLNDAQDQSYCLPSPSDSADDLQQLLEVNAPGKHQAYSRQLAEYGTSTRTKLFVILVYSFITIQELAWLDS